MPPKSRTTKADDEDGPVQGETGDLCTEGCFPDGWGDNDTAQCVHGDWRK